jgi:hypothetical protein
MASFERIRYRRHDASVAYSTGNVSSLRLLRLDVVLSENPIRPGSRIVGRIIADRVSLAFLAPKLVQAAVEGRLPCGIGVTNISPDEGDLRA